MCNSCDSMPYCRHRKCGLFFTGRGKKGYCCGHCLDRDYHHRGCHGKSCKAEVICNGCNQKLLVSQCMISDGDLFCCGPCKEDDRIAHCVVRNVKRPRRGPTRAVDEQQPEADVSSHQGVHPQSSSSTSITLCVVCKSQPLTHACTPCGHFCLCEDCHVTIVCEGHKCPVCRGRVVGIQRIYV